MSKGIFNLKGNILTPKPLTRETLRELDEVMKTAANQKRELYIEPWVIKEITKSLRTEFKGNKHKE